MKRFKAWRLRRAQEQYATWKARREMLEKQLAAKDFWFENSFNRNRTIRAAGQEAKFMERVEILMRQ